MFWWQYVLIFLFFVFICVIWLIVVGISLYIRSTITDPLIQGIFIKNNAKVERETLNNVSVFSTDWRLKSFDRDKVRFSVKPKGIGKSREMEHDADDFIEFNMESGKKVILFGIRNFDYKVGLALSTLQRNLNTAISRASILDQKYKEAISHEDERVKTRVDEIKSAMPVVINAKGSGKKA